MQPNLELPHYIDENGRKEAVQMSDKNIITKNLINIFIENYTSKLFYFCLKKTGNSFEAEDLTSEISLNIFSALRNGTVPTNFPAWVWQIARNCYSVWADRKHRRNESVYGANINDLELADDTSIENDFVCSEELSLLRRELAFISSDYREIVIAYYVEDRSIRNIASSLSLPEGTVKSKLFRARNILKEGMNMAREFGVMSYKPENVGFIMNGICDKNGVPWSIINRDLCKNIMLAAYRTPSTAEELSIELGVALPYMEDELRVLVNTTLLKKNCDKYETNIFIVSAGAQEKIYNNLRKVAPEVAAAVIAVKEYEVKCLEEDGSPWHGGYQPYEDMKWALLMQTVDKVNFGVLDEANRGQSVSTVNLGKWGHTKRPNGGEWDLLGLEDYKGNRPDFVGLHGCVDTPDDMDNEIIDFGQFKFNYKRICDKTPVHISYREAKALAAASNGDISDISPGMLDKLIGYGYLEKDGDKYHPTFCVMFKSKMKSRSTEREKEYIRLFDLAKDIGFKHYKFCRDVIYSEIPEFLKNDFYQINHACANIYEMRGAVLEEAIRTGYISYADNDERRMLGAYLII